MRKEYCLAGFIPASLDYKTQYLKQCLPALVAGFSHYEVPKERPIKTESKSATQTSVKLSIL